jgi:hypothetical protein
LPCDSDILKRAVNDGEISSAHSFSSLTDIPSGPEAFSAGRLDMRQFTSLIETVMDSRIF